MDRDRRTLSIYVWTGQLDAMFVNVCKTVLTATASCVQQCIVMSALANVCILTILLIHWTSSTVTNRPTLIFIIQGNSRLGYSAIIVQIVSVGYATVQQVVVMT